ncbi:unnamed protein product [Phytomonas sp. EM1]|nr:unnamed protein product [Phytomonas sp. EM1]|eukprot:CCW64952.1 unnamed protein product [Phytomonas sp. isolate EM1]
MVHTRRFSRTSRSGTWISLGANNLVRLLDIKCENIDIIGSLNTCMVAYNKCGGLIAIFHKDISIPKERKIYLYNSMLRLHPISPSITVTHDVVFMCWNDSSSHLIVIMNNKSIHFFDYQGGIASPAIFIETLPQLFASTESGLVGLTYFIEDYRVSLLFLLYSERDGYVLKTVDLPLGVQRILSASAMLVVPSQQSDTGFPEVYLPAMSTPSFSDVYHCVLGPVPKCSSLNISFSGGSIRQFALSPDGNCVSLLLEDGSIYYTNRSFEDTIKIGCIENNCMSQLSWCGNGCVACLTVGSAGDNGMEASATLFLINPDDSEVSDCIYDLPPDTLLLQECDGLRLVGTALYQFLQVVSSEVRQVFSVGSRAYGAVLLSTYDEYVSGNAVAVTMIQELQQNVDGLVEAINDCVAASNHELDVSQQKRLLRIAAFGKSFCPVYGSDFFVSTAQKLRVRNTLRNCSLGMLLTHEQLCSLGEERLIGRLVCCNEFQVAYSICDTLGIQCDDVLIKWALAKLTRSKKTLTEEKEVAHLIVQKLKKFNRPLFSELARLVNMHGNRVAALVFLRAEANPSRRVLMFLSIGESELALESAIATSDTDLIFTVVSHLIESRGAQSLPLLETYEESRALLFQYAFASEVNRQAMDAFFQRNPRYQTIIGLHRYFQEENRLRSSLGNSRLRAEVQWEMLQECKSTAIQQTIVLASKEANQPAPANTHGLNKLFSPLLSSGEVTSPSDSGVRSLRTHLLVIEEQTSLMKEFNDDRFLTASIVDMICLVLEHGRQSIADRLKIKFNVSDKAFQWCMLNAFSRAGQWSLIDELGSRPQTQHLISAEHFVNVLLSYNRPQQAKQYIPRVPLIERRMEYYVLCEDWLAAATDCHHNGDTNLLSQLKERAKGNQKILEQIDQGWNQQQRSSGLNLSRLFI